MKILIELEGGCVTDVYCSDPNVEVVIRDMDDISDDPGSDPLRGSEELAALREDANLVY